jgi:hypothetical protein
MPISKRTDKARRAPRTTHRKTAEPPIIEPLPFHKEAFYAGLGLVDWAAERAARITAKLRLLEKDFVARGQQRSVGLCQQIEAARTELKSRSQEFQGSIRRRAQDIWAALHGSNRRADPNSTSAPGTA